MPISVGIATSLRAKKETTWGVAAGAASAQVLRRVQSTLGLNKDTYESGEIIDTYQTQDMRHGTRRVEGAISGELSGGTYQMFFDAMCRRAAATVTTLTGVGLTIALDVAAPQYSVTRGAGSWLSDNIKVGHVVRFSVGSLNAANLNKNLLVTDITSATVMKVRALGDGTMVAEGPIAGCTVTVPGKVNFMPITGHTDDSFSIEHWRSDISVSELFTGCKIGSGAIKLPATGMSTVEFGFMGKDMTRSGAQYFTSPTGASTSGLFAAVNGAVRVGGVNQAILTGMDINIDAGMSMGNVIGSNTTPDIFEGRMRVSGQMTVYYQDGSFYDNFLNESEIEVLAVLTASNAAAADFVSMAMTRVKLGGAAPDDGEKGLIQTVPFTALLNTTGGAGNKNNATTFQIQDSLYV